MSLKILFFVILSLPLCAWQFPWSRRTITIVIDPAGDAQKPGRKIGDSFERSHTYAWAQHLKECFENQMDAVHVIITRMPGQVIQPYANAQLANQLNADLVLCLSCYQETEPKPRLTIFQYANGQEFITAFKTDSLLPIELAHVPCIKETSQIASHVSNSLATNTTYFQCNGFYKLPLSPLVGFKCPALLFEYGIKKDNSWQPIVGSLVASIKTWFENHE